MEQNLFRETDNFLASQEVPHNVQYCVKKIPLLVLLQSRINPFTPSNKISFQPFLVSFSNLRQYFPNGCCFFSSPVTIFHAFSITCVRATCRAILSFLDLITTVRGQYFTNYDIAFYRHNSQLFLTYPHNYELLFWYTVSLNAISSNLLCTNYFPIQFFPFTAIPFLSKWKRTTTEAF